MPGDDRAAQPGLGQAVQLGRDLQFNLGAECMTQLLALFQHRVARVGLDACQAQPGRIGDRGGERHQLWALGRQATPACAHVEFDEHAERDAGGARRPLQPPHVLKAVSRHGYRRRLRGAAELAQRARIHHLVRDQGVAEPRRRQGLGLPGGLASDPVTPLGPKLAPHQPGALVRLEMWPEPDPGATQQPRRSSDVAVGCREIDQQAGRGKLRQQAGRQLRAGAASAYPIHDFSSIAPRTRQLSSSRSSRPAAGVASSPATAATKA